MILISHEGFLMPSSNDIEITSDRIMAIGYDVEIILTIRNQIDLLESFYTSAGHKFGHMLIFSEVKKKKTLSIQEWIQFNSSMFGLSFSKSHHKSMISLVDFEKTVFLLEKKFGFGKIHVIPYELIDLNPSLFNKNMQKIFLCDFPKINSKNIDYFQNLTTRTYYKKIPYFASKVADYLVFKFYENKIIPRYKIKIHNNKKKELKDMYREGNKKLNERYNLNLNHLNYPT